MSNQWRDRLATLGTPAVSAFLEKQRWFGAKSRQVAEVTWPAWAELEETQSVLAWAEIRYTDGASETYFVPLASASGAAAETLRAQSILSANAGTTLYDGLLDDSLCKALLSRIRGAAVTAEDTQLPVKRGSAEQSNSSILFGDRWIMKVFRRPAAGKNPDCEICRYLTGQTAFRHLPPFGGSLEYQGATVAMLQGLVPNEGDGWEWTLRQLQQYYEHHSAAVTADAAALLGRRTAELHLALAAATSDPDFAPEPLEPGAITLGIKQTVERAFAGLAKAPPGHDDLVKRVLALQPRIAAFLQRLETMATGAQRIRIHGDYHLGQVLRANGDFVLLDFEGEPTRPLAERRAKYSPLKDVAGMLRSFSYASEKSVPGRTEAAARTWEQRVGTEFLRAYRNAVAQGDGHFLPPAEPGLQALLDAYLLDKAAYELLYELENRPTWIGIPLRGMLALPF